jgi:protein arginine N-methyltransferase 1
MTGVWRQTEAGDGVVLDMSGDDIEGRKTSDSWKHCYLPIEHAVEVRVGDIVEVTYRRQPPAPKDAPFRQRLAWTGSVRRAGKVLVSFQSGMD